MASKSAKECAVAVNQLISLDCEDQGALLEVLDSYFCHPNRDLDSDDSNTEDELEDDPTATEVPLTSGVDQGAYTHTTIHTIIQMNEWCVLCIILNPRIPVEFVWHVHVTCVCREGRGVDHSGKYISKCQ